MRIRAASAANQLAASAASLGFRPADGRLWQVDFFRGIAVLMMVAFHLLFDLDYFAGFRFILSSGFWLVFARLTLVMFLLLVGISLSLSFSKANVHGRMLTWKYLKRGLRIFLYGVIITLVTYALLPRGTIWFGVLHLIGVSIALSIPFLGKKRFPLAAGLACIIAGYFISQATSPSAWLLPLGVMPQVFYSFDYVPILPWFGVVLIGLFVGNNFITERAPGSIPAHAKLTCFLGRNSLFIYLLHQPVLVGILLAMGMG